MYAAQFNKLYEQLVVNPLCESGFERRGRQVYFEFGESILALLRFERKFSAFVQETYVSMCLRHRFLRSTQDDCVPDARTDRTIDYPFKFRPSTFNRRALKKWKYRGYYAESRAHNWDLLEYGAVRSPLAVHKILETITANALVCGRALAEQITPERAQIELLKRGDNVWCEKRWNEDYQLQSRSARQ